MLFTLLKALHVLGALLFLGVGLGSAWYKFQADRSGDVRVVAWCQHQIVLADWLFTVPSALLLPTTGLGMVWIWGMPLTTPWILFGLTGFTVAGLLWLPAVWLQIRMRTLADEALANGAELPEEFWRARWWWLALGAPAFALAVAVVWVMVSKQVPF